MFGCSGLKCIIMERKRFKPGNVVYRLSNRKFRMIIERIETQRNVIVCGWIDSTGEAVSDEFKPDQIGNVRELNTGVKVRV
jgi:hypothetical protein